MELADDPYPPAVLTALIDLPFTFLFLNGVILILLLLLSGLVSGSEIAFFSLEPEELKNDETKRSNRLLALIQEPRELLATILILNNLINVFIVTLSTYILWQAYGKNAGGGTLAVLTVVITVLITFFGEIVPKVLASQNAMKFATRMRPMIEFFKRAFSPLSWFLISISSVIERKIQKEGYDVSVEELNHALELTAEDETTEEEKGILKGIVNFGTLSVKQIMKSRIDITSIDREINFHELMDQINKTGFSRLPVYSETIDKVEGILYIKDVLPHLNKDEYFEWQKLLREALFVPESKKIDDLFRDFQEKQVHLAVVVDEYGGTEGLITMEDIIEEIVGEINDEFDDEEEVIFKKIDEKTHTFEGKTSLNDFCKILQLEADTFDEIKGESESLGGLLLEVNQKLPNTGEEIDFEEFKFTVLAVDQKRIKKVRVFRDFNTKVR